MTTRDKLPPGNYQIYPTDSPDQQSGKYTEKAEGIPTFSDYRKKTRTEDNQFLTNYQSSISTIVGTASIGTKPSNNILLATRNYYLTDSEVYTGDNPHKTNQGHPPSHLLPHLLENRFRPGQPLVQEFTVYCLESPPIQYH